MAPPGSQNGEAPFDTDGSPLAGANVSPCADQLLANVRRHPRWSANPAGLYSIANPSYGLAANAPARPSATVPTSGCSTPAACASVGSATTTSAHKVPSNR